MDCRCDGTRVTPSRAAVRLRGHGLPLLSDESKSFKSSREAAGSWDESNSFKSSRGAAGSWDESNSFKSSREAAGSWIAAVMGGSTLHP